MQRRLGLSPLLARVLVARGLQKPEHARSFLRPTVKSSHDPLLLKDMPLAVERIARALKQRESLCIYGDYDADGITATVLLLRFFEWQGHPASFYIPHRINEGYGLNPSAIEELAHAGFQLLITVDNGISCLSETELARSLGMDVVITDHHCPGDQLPQAVAVVDPARHDCPYPFPYLSGVGVAYKLVEALMKHLRIPPVHQQPFLQAARELVALGTIADVTPLMGENRLLVTLGLESLRETQSPGLQALMEAARVDGRRLGSTEIAYWLAPRLNAPGRTAHASLSVDLLLSSSLEKARPLARRLNRLNEQRQRWGKTILNESIPRAEKLVAEQKKVLTLWGVDWHLGIVGSIASRLKELFHRPTIVLAIDGDYACGSARSIDGFDLMKAFDFAHPLLLSYGGHPKAAGLRLLIESLNPFSEALQEYASQHLDEEALTPTLSIDALVTLDLLTPDNVTQLENLEPFGEENPPPIFALQRVHLLEPPRVVGQQHLKFKVYDRGAALEVIGYGKAPLRKQLKAWQQPVNVAFTPAISRWSGRPEVELRLHDFQPAS